VTTFSESVVEEAALAWLEASGWQVAHGPEIAPDMPAAERGDYGEVVLARRLRDALARLNPALPAEALDDAFRRLTRLEGAELVGCNRALHRLLVDGVTVEYRLPAGQAGDADGAIRGAQARVIDFDDVQAKDWLAVNQFTVADLPAGQAGNKHARRPDVVLFVNGLPLAVVELKNAADENATIWSAFQQRQTYKAEVPALFATNAVLVVSDGVEARAGTLSAGREWFKPWRTISGDTVADTHSPELQSRGSDRPWPSRRPPRRGRRSRGLRRRGPGQRTAGSGVALAVPERDDGDGQARQALHFQGLCNAPCSGEPERGELLRRMQRLPPTESPGLVVDEPVAKC
jgi:type I restriction enzyme R subunit